MDRGVQRRTQGALQLRLLRRDDRGSVARQRRAARRPEESLGLEEVESYQPAGGEPLPAHRISQGMELITSDRCHPAPCSIMNRCAWARNELSVRYHDAEWGVPVHDDRALFEFLILEGAQAGLSWDTILKKRERYRQVFDNFHARK